ncbi:MAG: putative sulfate exporter family transporter [Thermodesulfovibrionales bacterium]|nr:putative sulfate exporter family transporter [Thermodesulfovibrionales bacterium]
MGKLKGIFPGLTVTLLVAIISFLTSSLHQSFDLLVISIVFGMLVSSLLGEKEVFLDGINAALRFFLPIGIGIYGLQLEFGGAEMKFWPIVAGVFIVAFFTTYFVSRAFGLDRTLSVLLGSGMSICGASAIVVVAPLLDSKKEDTSIALISILTVGLTGMLIYKFLPQMTGISPLKFAILSGTTLPMFGQVKVAAAALGPEVLSLAVKLKLLRISFLIFLACGVLFFMGRRKKRFYIPWFMVLFFVLAAAVNFSETVAGIRGAVEPVGRFSLATALAAIGLSIDVDSITDKGASPLLVVFLSWGIIVTMVFLILNVINV